MWLVITARSVEALGVNDRLVRTSVFRLAKEGWLEVEREGRKSFYGFTRSGSKEYQRAAQRIYSAGDDSWHGSWQLLLPTNLPETQRDDFRRSLHWLGFRAISNGTFARPGGDEESIRDLLDNAEAPRDGPGEALPDTTNLVAAMRMEGLVRDGLAHATAEVAPKRTA